jgi:hypothetical protein
MIVEIIKTFQSHYDKLKAFKKILSENDTIQFYDFVKKLNGIIKKTILCLSPFPSTSYTDISKAYEQLKGFVKYKGRTKID